MRRNAVGWMGCAMVAGAMVLVACRATVAGDPNRPIRIEAHVTVDVRQIKEEAHSIEDLVSGKGVPASKPSSQLSDWVSSTAWAQELSPEMQQAVHSRRDRFPQLKAAKAKGWIGEDNQGHVAVLEGGGEALVLVEAENRNRETIYQASLKQKNLPADAMPTIRAAFAQEQRERAEVGEKIQLPSGEWTTK